MAEKEFTTKRKFRDVRTHKNPFSADDKFPLNPAELQARYEDIFACLRDPSYTGSREVNFLDIGSGYGRLEQIIAPQFPDKLMLGLEIRPDAVAISERELFKSGVKNGACITANTMMHLHLYFEPESLEKIFILYPDPQFKRSQYRRRIVQQQFLDTYAYLLKPGGRLYIATDVEPVYHWIETHLTRHAMFIRDKAEQEDEMWELYRTCTDDALRAMRKKGMTEPFAGVWIKQ
ncbi:hypothetical protein PCE1_002595 [Barthelona sp. PCE]